MTDETHDAPAPKRSYTAPKGKPTRTRSGGPQQRRVFGPVTQWIALVALVIVVVAVLIAVTNGGDFNPLDDDSVTGSPAQVSPAAAVVPG
jgi:hypothetical protein